MPLKLQNGSVMDAEVEALVNTVNCVGVMGKGIALQFKLAYPENFEMYRAACKAGDVKPGHIFIVQTKGSINPRYIFNFPTKRHWRGASRLDDIQSGLRDLVYQVRSLGIKSIAIPALGCGNGGLDWQVVRPIIEEALAELKDVVDVRLYGPHGAPTPSTQPVHTNRPSITPVRAALLAALKQYRTEGYKHSLLEMQKIAYFLQEAGLPLRLRFRKHKFGPYAEQLNIVLQRLEGHYIRGYGDRSRAAEIELMPGAIDEANMILATEPATRDAIDSVVRVIRGYETPYGMELLATVHWVMSESKLAKVDPNVTVSTVQAWNSRKLRLFKAEHIRRAREHLLELNWIRE